MRFSYLVLALSLLLIGCSNEQFQNQVIEKQINVLEDNPYQAKPLAYDRFYLIGDSLSDIRSQKIKVVMNFDLCLCPFVITKEMEMPDPRTYYQYRYCNGHNFFDYLKDLIPELPVRDSDNFALQGSGSQRNIIDFYTQEGIDEYLGDWKDWISSINTTSYPGFSAQFDQVVAKETSLSPEEKQKSALVFVWSGGMHNDIMALPYLAGYKNQWTKMPTITSDDMARLQVTLKQTAINAGKMMQENIQKLYDVGVRNVVFFEGLPIHLTPHFAELKKKYKEVEGFSGFVDSMADSYNNIMKSYIDALRTSFTKQGKSMNITYIPAKNLNLEIEVCAAFVNDKGERDGQIFELANATEADKKILADSMFYDPIHLTSNGAYKVATYVVEQLRAKEANIRKYNAAQPKMQ